MILLVRIAIRVLIYFLLRILNACSDTIQHHYHKSIFITWGPFFSIDSWRNKYINRDPAQGRRYIKLIWIKTKFTSSLLKRFNFKILIPVQITDLFHSEKTLNIFFCTYLLFADLLEGWQFWLAFTAAGVIGNLFFNLFYEKLLIKKSK